MVWCAIYTNVSVTRARKVLRVMLAIKVTALVVIIIGGFYWMTVNGADHLKRGFKG